MQNENDYCYFFLYEIAMPGRSTSGFTDCVGDWAVVLSFALTDNRRFCLKRIQYVRESLSSVEIPQKISVLHLIYYRVRVIRQ